MWWTFAAATIASGTALIIAFIAYPWQKQKDRELQVGKEARDAAREFIGVLQNAFLELSRDGEMTTETNNALNQSTHLLHLYFEAREVSLARKYIIEHVRLARQIHEIPDEHQSAISFQDSDEAGEQFIEMVKAKYHAGNKVTSAAPSLKVNPVRTKDRPKSERNK